MVDRITIAIIVGAVALFVIVLDLVRRRKLEEQHSLLWLAAAAGLIVLSLTRDMWEQLVLNIGIAYPPTALFIALFVAMILILLHFSTVISRLTRQNRKAAQQIGLLEQRLRELEERQKSLDGRIVQP
jgi:hypothetical protein